MPGRRKPNLDLATVFQAVSSNLIESKESDRVEEGFKEEL
jgi:hypothetical protein